MQKHDLKKYKLNNGAKKVEKIPGVPNRADENPLGKIYNPYLFGTTILVASTGTGKTTVEFHMLKETIGPNTIVYLFCGTIFLDDSYIGIVSWLKENNILYNIESSIYDDRGRDLLKYVLDYLKLANPKNEWDYLISPFHTPPEPPKKVVVNDDIYGMKNLKTKKKEVEKKEEEFMPTYKYNGKDYPKYIFIFDDLSDEIRGSKSLKKLTKAARHFKAKIYISTQDVIDIEPGIYPQVNLVLAFSDIPDDEKSPRLEKLYANLALSRPSLDRFREIYYDATSPDKKGERSRNFLYIDRPAKIFKQNFRQQYLI